MAKEKEICLYGRKAIQEALVNRKNLDKIFFNKHLQGKEISNIKRLAHSQNIVIQTVPQAKLDKLARIYIRDEPSAHQGIIGFTSLIAYYKIEDVIDHSYHQGKPPFLLLLDGITDVRNFGAIARSAHCFGVDAIIIPQKGSAQVTLEAMKASAGALNQMRICRVPDLIQTIKELKLHGIEILGTDVNQAKDVSVVDFSTPLCIIMGSEGTGMSNAVKKSCDKTVHIPLQANFDSLNVSVATGILLYEASKMRAY